MFNSMPNAQHT